MSERRVTLPIDAVHWALDARRAVTPGDRQTPKPPAPTTTRANLAAHWQWRYSRLEDDCNHTYDLLIQALADVQSYREMTHVLLDALHNANKLAKRHRDTMNRLRKERQEGQKS